MCSGQLKVLHNLLPASSGVERGGGRGASAPGPGQIHKFNLNYLLIKPTKTICFHAMRPFKKKNVFL